MNVDPLDMQLEGLLEQPGCALPNFLCNVNDTRALIGRSPSDVTLRLGSETQR